MGGGGVHVLEEEGGVHPNHHYSKEEGALNFIHQWDVNGSISTCSQISVSHGIP